MRDYDLTISQFGTLEALYHLGPMQLGELGVKILKSSGNMTLVVDNLVNRGLVTRQRCEDDRRSVDIHLTEAGTTLIQSIMQPHVAQVVQALNVLSATEQETVAELCRKLGLAQG